MKEENKKEKIAAVVVTYNRKELLKECLDALLAQTYPVDSIILIDNASIDGTPEFLKEQGYLKNPKLDYVKLPENTGGAGGFYEGVKRGYEKGYDWLWLMDDDAEPKENALELMIPFIKKKEIVGISNLKIGINGNPQYNHSGWIKFYNIIGINEEDIKNETLLVDFSSFVGFMVSRTAVGKIGFPQKEFFINNDDLEYCIRLRQVGKILLVPNSVIVHKEAVNKNPDVEKIFCGRKSIRFSYDKLWLSYYGRRNLIWLRKKYSSKKFKFYLRLFKDVLKSIKSIIEILIYDDNKFRRISFEFNIYFDGLKGNFDNEKPKRILYK